MLTFTTSLSMPRSYGVVLEKKFDHASVCSRTGPLCLGWLVMPSKMAGRTWEADFVLYQGR